MTAMQKRSTTQWLTTDQQQSWRAYLRGSRLLEVALDRDLVESHGVQLSEYEILSMVSESEGSRLRMSVIAGLVVQSRSRVTHTAKRLEQRGWVVRESCLKDRRGVELVLTPAGREVIDEMSTVHVESVQRHLIEALTPEQLTALGEAMMDVQRANVRPTYGDVDSAGVEDALAGGDGSGDHD